ncbi:MAG: hypothetical protein ACE5HS_00060 [bacterium]
MRLPDRRFCKNIGLFFSFIWLMSLFIDTDNLNCEEKITTRHAKEVLSSVSQDTTQKTDAYFGKDKIQHFLASAFITGLGFAVMREPFDASQKESLFVGGGAAFTLGLSKEIYDWKGKKGHASYKDLIADILGIGLAVLIIKMM